MTPHKMFRRSMACLVRRKSHVGQFHFVNRDAKYHARSHMSTGQRKGRARKPLPPGTVVVQSSVQVISGHQKFQT